MIRALILTPTAFPSISGNAVTAERWRRALTKKGITVSVLSTDGLNPSAFRKHLQQFRPDLIHVHHAFRSGGLLVNALSAEPQTRVPVVASPGGTDINEDLGTPGKREVVFKVFELARIIIGQSPEVIQRVKHYMPALSERVIFVPKAVCWFGEEPCDLRRIAGCNHGDILFLLPAGIRPVKGNLECLMAMERVHAIRTKIRFVAAGPAVDKEYAGRFMKEVVRLSAFARWIEPIPSAAMKSAYCAADVVLNSSFSEGLSNSLVEAIAAGRPMLASDIPGNRWPVFGENGDFPAGLLFDIRKPEDLVAKALKLIDESSLREALGRAAVLRQARLPREDEEADGLIAAYNTALSIP